MTESKTIRLFACPLCGGKPEMCELGDPDSYYVRCTECEIQRIANFVPVAAAERWNNRAVTASDVTYDIAIPAAVRWRESGHA